MPAYKAVPIFVIIALVVATGVFYFMEDLRPPVVERMFLAAAGFGPAKTPNEALDKFKEAIRKRNYKAAASLCGGEYAEELRRAAKRATALGNATEELLHNLKEVAAINSPKVEIALKQFYPFPNDIKILDIKEKKDKDGNEVAVALLRLGDDKPIDLNDAVKSAQQYKIDPRIILAVTPRPWDGSVELKLEGDKQKSWKIYFPVSLFLRESMQYLRDNGGNYTRALDNIKYSIKHEAATKAEIETQLQRQLDDARSDR